MKLLEDQQRVLHREAAEIIPTQTAYSAITIGLALKIEAPKWQRGKLRDRTWRKQRNGYPLGAGVLTSDARDAF